MQYQKTWQLIEKQQIHSAIKVDHEWMALTMRREVASAGNKIPLSIIPIHQERSKIKSSLYKVWKVAAAITVLLVSSFLLYYYFSKPANIVVVAQGTTIEQVLPDGSVVTLQVGSQLSYPETFASSSRNVELKGEAYFNVAHDKTKPFIVASGDARIEVLGTQFNINTQSVDKRMEVVLASGKVSVYYKTKPQDNVLLMPGEKAVLNPEQYQISKSLNTDPNYLAWKTRVLIFDNESLGQVANTLQHVYQTPVVLADPSLSACRVTATFNEQSLASVVQVLKETRDLTVEQNGIEIVLSGKACK
jgi:ferric-dicitrate binding protein FerR (iron transport regulator)